MKRENRASIRSTTSYNWSKDISRLQSLRAPFRCEPFRVSQQSSDGFAPVPSDAAEFVEQVRLRPWWLAPGVPLGQHVQRLLVVEREPSRKPAADPERMNVAVLTGNRRRHGGDVPLRPLDDRLTDFGPLSWFDLSRLVRRLLYRGKVAWPIANVHIPVLDRDEMRLRAFVVDEAGQPRVLRDRGRCRIGAELARKLLLQPFNDVTIKRGDTPEHVHVIRRRMQNVAGWRQVATICHTRE